MKGLVWTFVIGVSLLLGTYAVLIGAVSFPALQPPRPADIPAPAAVQPHDHPAQADANSVTLTREAAQNVIDCYAGKPVYLEPESRRPLYPPCDRLLRIYMDHTSEPEQVMALLAEQPEPEPVPID